MSLLKALGVEKIIDERVSKLEGEALESVTTARRLVQNIAENKNTKKMLLLWYVTQAISI